MCEGLPVRDDRFRTYVRSAANFFLSIFRFAADRLFFECLQAGALKEEFFEWELVFRNAMETTIGSRFLWEVLCKTYPFKLTSS